VLPFLLILKEHSVQGVLWKPLILLAAVVEVVVQAFYGKLEING
jgi:hypothetical protein